MSLRSSSIMIDVRGSRPEFGSSQNRYLGFRAIARAMATRFCIPPDISDGYLSSALFKPTRLMQKWARSTCSSWERGLNIFRGKSTLPNTVSLSNRADPWKSIPISVRNARFCCSFMERNFRPSYRIVPSSGESRPIRHFMKTVFPSRFVR